eukprot:9390216-Pyramimonas_sp.AAC.1
MGEWDICCCALFAVPKRVGSAQVESVPIHLRQGRAMITYVGGFVIGGFLAYVLHLRASIGLAPAN